MAGSTEKFGDVYKLQATIESIDALSQEGFTEISAIASTALAAMESPNFWKDITNVQRVLESIRSKANESWNSIGCEVEASGCGWEDNRRTNEIHSAYLAASKKV